MKRNESSNRPYSTKREGAAPIRGNNSINNSNNNNNYNNGNNISRNKDNTRKKKEKKKNKFANIIVISIIAIIIVFIILFINKNFVSEQKKDSNANNGISTAGSTAQNSTPSAFWGNDVDLSKEITPLQGGKALNKWPSSAGFDIIPADISSYKSKNYGDTPLKGITVILDPGHGGEDLGAVYPRAPKPPEIIESKINLAIASITKGKLEALGAKVVLTRADNTYNKLYYRSAIVARTTLTDFYDKLSDSSKNKNVIKEYIKQINLVIETNSDDDKTGWFYGLGVRREIKNIMDLQASNTNFIYLSLHCNSNDNPDTMHGTKVYYSSNKAIYDDEAKIDKDKIFPEYQFYNDIQREKFASILYNNITQDNPSMVQKDSKTAVSTTNYSVIREQNLVSALIEMGYVNHTSDRAFLLNPSKQKELSESIAKAIFEYYCKN